MQQIADNQAVISVAERLSCYRQDPGLETDSHGVDRIPYREQGWNFWKWQNHKIHYVQAGAPVPTLLPTAERERDYNALASQQV